MENKKQPKGLNISAKSFITSIVVLLVLMILTYGLTFIIPSGEFQRVFQDGRETIVSGTFTEVEGGISFFKWLASPVLLLGASGSGTIIAVIAFLLVIGGIFNALDKCGLIQYMLNKIVHKFRSARYRLVAFVSLFFMCLGTFIGSFEECVPLVPLVVALSVSFGWDAITGVAMSLLATGCGFAAGVSNPFTVGVAQEIAGLEMLSGIWLRAIAFVLIYGLLLAFLFFRIRKLEKKSDFVIKAQNDIFVSNKKMDVAIVWFVSIIAVGILLVLSSSFIPFIRDITMPVIAVMFLIAGTVATLVSGLKVKALFAHFGNGALSIAPAVLMILMASSIKYILSEAKVLDTLLYKAMDMTSNLPTWSVILFIYLIALIMNFFISSGSAKAFLLMPLVVPIADICGISRQLCVMAYAFGDGFSNVFYITNPVLLISLGLAGISYGKWVKWSWKFQICNLILTSAILLFGFAVNYN